MTDLQRHDAAQMTATTALALKFRRPRLPITAFGVTSTALVMEVLPVVGVVLLLTAWMLGHATLLLPLWWFFVLILAAYAIGRHSFLQHLAPIVGVMLALAVWTGTLLGSFVLSPDAYGHLSLDMAIATFVHDLRTGNIHPQIMIALLSVASLTTYLWWRGLVLSRRQFTREHLSTSFRAGQIVLVAAIFVAQPLHVLERNQVHAGLALLLPTEVFVGLIGVALAHLTDAARIREERQRGRNGAESEARGGSERVENTWFVMALAVSGGIVAGALGITVLVWNSGGQALSMALARLFAPMPSVSPPPGGATGGAGGAARSGFGGSTSVGDGGLAIPNNIWFAALLGLVVAVGILLLWTRLHERRSREQNYEELRERLSVREALDTRWRALTALATRYGQHTDATVAEEPLPAGSVRQIYREMLRSAAHVGRGRAVDETPAEYAERLISAAARAPANEGDAMHAHHGASDESASQNLHEALTSLTNAYCQTRYGTSDDEASRQVRDAQQHVIHWLSKRIRYTQRTQKRLL